MFISTFRDSIGHESVVLDIGAGSGGAAYRMAQQGAQVDAVSLETLHPDCEHPRLRFRQARIETWLTEADDRHYTHVNMCQILQFLESRFVTGNLETWLWNHTSAGSTLHIQTFHRLPQGWTSDQLMTLWSAADLQIVFHRWTPILIQQTPGRRCRARVGSYNMFWCTYALFRRPS